MIQWMSINTSGPDPNIFICVQSNCNVLRAAVALFQRAGNCGENNIHEKTVHCILISTSCVYCKQIKELLLTNLF